MPTIWGLLFARLQSSRTAKFTRSFVLFLALFVCKRGAQLVADSIDGVQPGLTTMIVQTVRAATPPVAPPALPALSVVPPCVSRLPAHLSAWAPKPTACHLCAAEPQRSLARAMASQPRSSL